MRSTSTPGRIVVMLLTVLFFSLLDFELALGQGQSQQQSFVTYKNPNLGVSIQYPSDWQLLEKSNDRLSFIKQEGFVTADLNVENLEESDTTLSEYANTRVNELQTQRTDFQLVSNEPITISNNKPAQKVVYTFEREEDGKANKVMRIWSVNEGKLYTLAYIAESSQYDSYLPTFQGMVDSFSIGTGNREDNNEGSSFTPPVNGNGDCDPSYPAVCIKSPPPDLNCEDVPYKNFKVTGRDPHGFDRDNDGIGCDSASGGDAPDQCTEDGLSAGSYFDPRNGFIVGSPCDPVEYCSDKGSTDPVVIDYCQDIWTDVDDCLDGQGNERYPGCSSEPVTCPIDAQGNEVCPPSDPTPEPAPCPIDAQGNEVCPPSDEPSPMPEPPPPECPDAGPEVCGEEPPPPEEVPPDSDDVTNDNGNGEDGSNGNEDDDEEGGGIAPVPPFG